jgi:hypothetical protein
MNGLAGKSFILTGGAASIGRVCGEDIFWNLNAASKAEMIWR